MMDHERLEVYRVSVELREVLREIVPRRGGAGLRDQLNRASAGIVLNIAEGAGRTARADKQRFYEIARGSATESAAALNLLRIDRIVGDADYLRARVLLVRIVAMLTRLCGPPRTVG